MRRAAYLKITAQLDAAKRQRGIDGLKQNDMRHRCGNLSTRIADPDAFATAFARGAEHSKVRDVLNAPYISDTTPRPVHVPIADLLGDDGHKLCTGWRLEPVSDSMQVARSNRLMWRAAERKDASRTFPSPRPGEFPPSRAERSSLRLAIITRAMATR